MTNILVVENNHMVRTMYVASLSDYDYTVASARNVAEAKAHLANGFNPQIILLDLQLPDEPGQSFMHYVRVEIGRPDIRIIVITGLDLSSDQIDALNVDLVLLKPIELQNLLDHVHQLLPPDQQTANVHSQS